MWPFQRPRIHESLALAAVLATAVTVNILWITNFLIFRLPTVKGFFEISPERGVIADLFLFGFVLFLIFWLLFSLIFKGRDCSVHRESGFWFLVVSLILFLIMTFPSVFSFIF